MPPVASHDDDDDTITILVLAGVGKTSLISTVVADHFPQVAEPVMTAAYLPLEVTFQNQILAIDTPGRLWEDREALHHELRRADVVVLCYATDEPTTFDLLEDHWLVEIENHPSKPPVLIVGLKADPASGEADEEASGRIDARTERAEAFKLKLEPLLRKFRCCDAAMLCSARNLLASVHDVFYTATRLVLFPVAPLFDVRGGQPTPALRRAIKRVFRIFDRDHDDLLSGQEIDTFQEDVFGLALPEARRNALVDVLRHEAKSYVSASGGVSESGLMKMLCEFIAGNRPDAVWMVLARFDYARDVALHIPEECVVVKRPDDAIDTAACLSDIGTKFLTNVFQQWSRGGVLNMTQLSDIFSVMPDLVDSDARSSSSAGGGAAVAAGGGDPGEMVYEPTAAHPWGGAFPHCTACKSNGDISLDAWLSQWAMTLLLDERAALKHLYLLGFSQLSVGSDGLRSVDLSTTPAVRLSSRRRDEARGRAVDRPTARCFVIGSKGCGKSSFVSAFLRRRPPSAYTPTTDVVNVVNRVEPDVASGGAGGEQRRAAKRPDFMVVSEFPEALVDRAVTEADQLADVACLCFDAASPESLEFVVAVQSRLPKRLPCVYVALRCDRVESADARQDVLHAADTHCAGLELASPTRLTVIDPRRRNDMTHTFTQLAEVAATPAAALPRTDEDRERDRRQRIFRAVGLGVGAIALGAAAVFGYRAWRDGRLGGAGKSAAK